MDIDQNLHEEQIQSSALDFCKKGAKHKLCIAVSDFVSPLPAFDFRLEAFECSEFKQRHVGGLTSFGG